MSGGDSGHDHAGGVPEQAVRPQQRPPGGSDRDTSAPVRRLTERCAGVVCGMAVVALAGWAFDARVLAWQWRGSIPMAPSTALAFLGLGGGLFVYARRPMHRLGLPLALVGTSLAALLGLLVVAQLTIGFDSGVERALARTNELFGRVPLGHMSPLTATSFLLESVALLVLLRVNRWRQAGTIAALLALVATAINVVVGIGYAYGVPLLYGGMTIPVALPTALAFMLVGTGEINLALPAVHVLRNWRGGSLRGRLLRAFLPGTLLLVFLEGWLDDLFGPSRTVNPALWDSVTALVACGFIVALTAWIARRTGDDIEEARDALHESESRLRAITDSAQDAILMMDPEGRVSYWNPAAERILGYSSAEALGQPLHEFIVPPHYRPAFYATFLMFRQAGQGAALGRTLDLEARTKDGRDIAVQVSLSAVHLHGGWYGVGVVRDITDQKQAEADRYQMEQRIQQTQKLESLGVLAGGIAHDFNNILTAVLGHADLALDEIPPTSAARSNLTEIGTAARRAAELCRQMLAYSGKSSFALERVDLNEIIEGMQQLVNTSISKKALLNLHLERGLPRMQADLSQIQQVVMNLLVNASEAMGEAPGVITVITKTRRCDAADLQTTVFHDDRPPGLYVQLEVADTGCGMDADTQARIFEPFFTTKFTGRGLGLAAVLGIVGAHKGVLKLESAPGRGTTFTILFPALEPPDDVARTAEVTATPAWQDHGTILFVDDEEQLRTLGARMLGRLGYTVLTAADGREAVATYGKQHGEIDMVILDLTMPHMDGAEAFDQLRRVNPNVRVILASGYSAADITARFANKKLSGIIQKPYSLGLLRDAVRKAMAEREGSGLTESG